MILLLVVLVLMKIDGCSMCLILELKAGENILRMEYILNTDEEDTRQFSNVLMIGFVAVDPAGELLTRKITLKRLTKH